MVNNKNKKDISEEVANWLISGLAQEGKSRAGLAKYTGVSRAAVAKWVKTGGIAAKRLPDVAEYLELNIPTGCLPEGEVDGKADDSTSKLSNKSAGIISLLETYEPLLSHVEMQDIEEFIEFKIRKKERNLNKDILAIAEAIVLKRMQRWPKEKQATYTNQKILEMVYQIHNYLQENPSSIMEIERIFELLGLESKHQDLDKM